MNNHILLYTAFSQFLKRLDSSYRSPLQYYGQSTDGIDYFIALSQALERKNTNPLTTLLRSCIDAPKEFLPLIGDVINGNYIKRSGGPIPTHTRLERINIYKMMCYERYIKKNRLSTIYGEFANMTDLESPLEEIYFNRLWNEYSIDPSVPKFYQNIT
jgi:hypothetical protein